MILPDRLIDFIRTSINNHQLDEIQRSSDDWNARNEGNTISGSSFSKCIRMCYYRFTGKNNVQSDPAFGENLDEKSRNNMYYGLLIEREIITALEKYGAGGVVHKDQQVPPTVQRYEMADGVWLSAANDLLIEQLDDKGSYFIPIEIKTGDRPQGFYSGGKWVNPDKWWKEYTGYVEYHRQVMQWMYLAELNGLRVPYGLIILHRRGVQALKFIVFRNTDVELEPAVEADEIIDYVTEREVIAQRNAELVTAIQFGEEPAYDPSVPSFLCSRCPHLAQCEETR